MANDKRGDTTYYDYSKLVSRIVEKFDTRAKFAGAMNLSERSMSLKLNNKVDWRQSEILEASKLLDFALADIPVYFFTLKDLKPCPSSGRKLIDTNEFIQELTDGRELTAHGYLFTTDEFNQFCLARNLQPRLVKRHLYAKGHLEATKEANGKVNYSIMLWIDGVSQRRIAIKA